MIPITLKSLSNLEIIEEVEILSIEISLYIVRLLINGKIYRVNEHNGNPYRRFSIDKIKEDFKNCNIKNVFIVHQSPYDEMVSHSKSNIKNAFRIPLNWD